MEEAEAAGSVAASEHSSGAAQQEESLQQGGSVNWGQPTAQSPRVPRSQVSRAHPAHNAGYGERTSAVLSALSGDDETALSAAEAAGEHTSEPQDVVGGMGEAAGEGPVGSITLPPQLALQQQPAHSLTAPRRGHELAGSPPASTSPMYRANSVVSHTAAPAVFRAHQQHQARRGAETPASAPAAAGGGGATLLGSSPPTSRGEFPTTIPQLRVSRRAAGFSAGLPPTSGQRSAQQHAAAGPSRPSLSGTQSHAVTAPGSLPSQLAVAVGTLSPPGGGGLLGQLTPGTTGLALPAPQPPGYGAAGMAGLLPLAASMGLPASQLGSMAAALLQAQSSVLGSQQEQQQQQQQQEQQQQQAAAEGSAQQAQQAQEAQEAGQGTGMPPPPPMQQALQQQAEALQSMAAMLQAQASAIISSAPGEQALQQPQEAAQQQRHEEGAGTAAEASPPAAGGQPQAGSAGAASVHSLPSLVGASAIQGHPLPPPFYGHAAMTPVPLHSFGGTPTAAAAGAAPPTGQSGAFGARCLPPAAAAGPLHPTMTAVSGIRGSAVPPAAAAVQQQQGQQDPEQLELEAGMAAGQAAAGGGTQATSMVQGSGNGGGCGMSGSPRRPRHRPSPSTDPEQRAAEEERRRHAGDPPRPQAAVIVELPTADVAAASQGAGAEGGHAGGGGEGAGPHLPPAVPQEAAMLGGNSTFADAMDHGAEDEGDDAMEVQQVPAGGGKAEGQGVHLPPAPHGAASVMATLITDNGGGRSEGDTEMQQAASGPSRSAAGAAAAQPAQSLSRSMAEPAAATAHNTAARSVLTEATQPSQQGPAISNLAQVAHALSSLATVSTGNAEGAGGSVEMSALPSQQAVQHATSAPAVMPAPLPPGQTGETAVAEPAVSHHAPGGPAAGPPHPAASAPAAVPPQLPLPSGSGAAGVQPAQPAASASMSGQGDTPGGLLLGATSAMPQSSAAAGPLQPAGQQQQHGLLAQNQHGDRRPPFTDARSRSAGNPAGGHGMAAAEAGAVGGPAAAMEGMGSPAASQHAVVQPLESHGTARGTILAGAAHSILTTAAAGEGEAMDEGGEALSPLLAAKAIHIHHAQAQVAAAAAASAYAAVPGSGSIGGAPLLPAAQPAAAAASSMAPPASRAGQQHQVQAEGGGQVQQEDGAGSGQLVHANGITHQEAGASQLGGGNLTAAMDAAADGFASPIDYSTMAVDMAPAGGADVPQPTASFQPSSLQAPGAAAAALAAVEQQQAVQNGSTCHTPLPLPAGAAELGELYAVLQQQQHNGYATHANSAIGNGHVAHSSPERELTSPSRLLTHDSTGSGSHQRRSKQPAKRRRTSTTPAGGSTHQG